ncbi:UDP-glycosyltransferase UGT5-like isoform X3 [Palaemon carinicauda]|uniref:UDP-glycosyltransferase UGT5-like isoform X3 n=1 Tax=Palaemon carinicauda TaxID=392227 RepID=UPI0035B69279
MLYSNMKWPSAALLLLMWTGIGGAGLPPPERSYKVLVLLPVGSKSHRNVFMPLVEALADRGHKIDMLTSYDIKHKNLNIREIPHGLPHYPKAQINMFDVAKRTSGIIGALKERVCKMARDMYQVPHVKELYRRRKEYDIIIIDHLFHEIDIHFPDLPPLLDIEKNQSLVLLNSHFSTGLTVPLLPSQVEVGGMHCRPAKPLPEDLKAWIEGAGSSGVIYFSLGSVTKGENLPILYRNMFIEAFSKLDQRIIWKYETDFEGILENVMINNWLPQQDILSHPNVKVFITHGGGLSLQEALYHSTPVLVLPLFGDQPANGARAVTNKWGLSLNYADLSVDLIMRSLKEIMSNPVYKENVEQTSRLYRDQLSTPVDRAVFWTEYVIRHGGAPKLRSPAASLSWVQLLLLDVLAVFFLSVILLLFILKCIVKKTLGVIFGPKVMKNKYE